MHFNRKILFLIGSCCWFSLLGHAQNSIAEKRVIPNISLDNLVQGRLYSPVYPGIKGSQFLTENWVLGSYQALDRRYSNVPLIYDLYTDDLILLYKEDLSLRFVQLGKNQIQQFALGKQLFIHSKYSAFQNVGLKSGYYEVLFKDNLSFLSKRKIARKKENALDVFYRKDTYFLIKDGHAYSIRNKKSLITSFGKRYKKMITSFAKQHKIRLKKASGEDYKKIIVHLNNVLKNEISR